MNEQTNTVADIVDVVDTQAIAGTLDKAEAKKAKAKKSGSKNKKGGKKLKKTWRQSRVAQSEAKEKKAAAKKKAESNGHPRKFKLTKSLLYVLSTLAKTSGALTRSTIAERVEKSGVKLSNGRIGNEKETYEGAEEKGWLKRIEIDSDGKIETTYKILDKGKKALAQHKAENK
jgi:DNA-binding PadR family transcriptional regulator